MRIFQALMVAAMAVFQVDATDCFTDPPACGFNAELIGTGIPPGDCVSDAFCTALECCQCASGYTDTGADAPNLTCVEATCGDGAFSCSPTHYLLTAERGTICTNDCDDAQCCAPLVTTTCADYECSGASMGPVAANSAAECSTASGDSTDCDDALCCAPTCDTYLYYGIYYGIVESGGCSGNRIKPAQPAGITCTGGTCTEELCCVHILDPTCDTYLYDGIYYGIIESGGCSGNREKPAQPADITCIGGTCTEELCCVDMVAPRQSDQGSVSIDCSSKRGEPGSDVVLLIGQSNMSGGGRDFDEALDAPNNPRILQWSRENTIILAKEHLEHVDHVQGSNRVGLGTSFGRAYVTTLPEQRSVLLVPAAERGTALVDGPWSPTGGGLFDDAVNRLQDALASNDGNCVAGVLWQQGERDAKNGQSEEDYQSTLIRLIDTLRSRVPEASQAPFVMGEFTPGWIAANVELTEPVLSAIRGIPAQVEYTAVAPSETITTTNDGDLIHYDSAGLRQYGRLYADTLADANANS